MTEEKLAKKAIRGNMHAYGELIRLYQNELYRIAYMHTKNEDDALDIVSDTIAKGYEHVHKLREPAYFKTWLIRVLLNTVHDHFRRYHETSDWELLENIPSDAPAPIGAEEKMDLYNAIDSLPEKYKSIIVLKYYNELKISEISEILCMPEGTIKANLHHAKKVLRDYLKEDYLYEA
ncbi:MAG: sigma-70 family RNA polymerase sigma factor [Lachnospiraceae bacterium]|nr:sigma-70 family RNA polymerase sigma factor [Lachnospiraceae bacterium]